jgi:hypothetical protein
MAEASGAAEPHVNRGDRALAEPGAHRPSRKREHYGNMTKPRDGRMGRSRCGLSEMAIQRREPISHWANRKRCSASGRPRGNDIVNSAEHRLCRKWFRCCDRTRNSRRCHCGAAIASTAPPAYAYPPAPVYGYPPQPYVGYYNYSPAPSYYNAAQPYYGWGPYYR